MTIYNIDYTDPLKSGFSIAPGKFNGPGGTEANSPLRLYGRSSLEWGEAVNENLVRILESFAGATAPLVPAGGQIWVQQQLYWRDEDISLPPVAVGNQGVAPVGAFYKFNLDTDVWETDPDFPVVIVNDPAGIPSFSGSAGMHVFNTSNSELYLWESPYKQATPQWMPRLKVVASTISPFEGLSAPINGVTTPPQTVSAYDSFIDEWIPVGVILGDLDMDGFEVLNLAEQTYPLPDSNTAATINYVNDGLAALSNDIFTGGSLEVLLDPRYVNITGDTMTGILSMSGNNITNLPLQTYPLGNSNNAATISYVNSAISSLGLGGSTGGGENAPVGGVMYFAMSTPPSGWLEANGAAVSRTTYADLFSRIGTTYGAGNGSTTFNLPDLRGEFIRGYDSGRGVDPGRGFGTLQLDALQNITATLNLITGGTSATGAMLANGPSFNNINSKVFGFQQGVTFDASRVARTSTETRPRNIAFMACIKAVDSANSVVNSFNTRTGAVTLQSSDITGALGYTPAQSGLTGLISVDARMTTGAFAFVAPVGASKAWVQLQGAGGRAGDLASTNGSDGTASSITSPVLWTAGGGQGGISATGTVVGSVRSGGSAVGAGATMLISGENSYSDQRGSGGSGFRGHGAPGVTANGSGGGAGGGYVAGLVSVTGGVTSINGSVGGAGGSGLPETSAQPGFVLIQWYA